MTWFYSGFVAFILVLLALDLGVFHKRSREVGPREALAWFAVWLILGLAFAGFVHQAYEHHWLGIGLGADLMSASSANPAGYNDGRSAALKYLTGYLIEKSLSVDNLFVIAFLFGTLGIPNRFRHRVLFWGILGALAMRGAMIALGATLVARFSWVLCAFGAVLILTALKMLLLKTDARSGQAAIALARRLLPVADRFHGQSFWTRAKTPADAARPGAFLLTPLALALLAVEFTDAVFAADSIPAVFAITTDPFLVFTSNVFALLGLRSLYFALEGVLVQFHHLKTALALIMLLVGLKLLTHSWLETILGAHFNLWTLILVAAILVGGVAASFIFPRTKERPA